MNDKTLSDTPLLIRLFIAAVYLIFTLLIAVFISNSEIKPKWFKYSIYASLFLASWAFFESWSEKRIFAAWAENFVALLFRFGGPILGIACGYFVGMRITKKTLNLYEHLYKKSFPDRLFSFIWWVVGIVIAVLVFLITIIIGEKIPGVGWRIYKDI